MMIELEDTHTGGQRDLTAAHQAVPMMDDAGRTRIASWLRAKLGPWTCARDLARLANVALEPTTGVPGGVVTRERVVYFEPSGGQSLVTHRLALGVSAVLLTDLLTTFTLADIEPLSVVLLALP